MKLTREQALEKLVLHSGIFNRQLDRLMKWNPDISVMKNAKELDIHPISASGFRHHFRLTAKSHGNAGYEYNKGDLLNDIKRAKALKKLGFSYTQIGRLYGVSRQRVEQVFMKAR